MKREFCKKCGIKRDGGHTTYCRLCYNAWKRGSYQRHRESSIARALKWNRDNRERFIENYRKHRASPKGIATANRWKSANKHKLQAYDQNKRVKRLSQIGGKKIDPSRWANLIKAHGYQCFYCRISLIGSKKLVMEHMTPLSRGGKHELENVVPACSLCNSRKFTKTAEEFMETR